MQLRRSFERRLHEALRVALSDYVMLGASAGLGLLLITTVVHHTLGAFPGAVAAIGVIAAIPSDQPARRRGKFWQLVPGAVIAPPLFFLTQVFGDDPLRLGMLIVPAAFVAFLCAAWGKRGIAVSVSAMFAVVFSMAIPDAEGVSPLRTTGFFAIGVACYLVYATLSCALLNGRYRVQKLADTLLAVAALMRTQAGQFRPRRSGAAHADAEPVGRLLRAQAAFADQVQGARDILLESPRTKRRQQLAGMLMRVLEIRDHLLACELDVDQLVTRPGQEEVLATLGETFHAIAHEIERIADCLLTGRLPVAFPSHRPRLAAIGPIAPDDPDGTQPSPAILARGLADRVGHLDDEALLLIAMARGEAPPNLAVVRASWQMFVSPTAWSIRPFLSLWRWDAPPLRHAVRAALAIGVAYLIALALPWGAHPYWILLTIVVVLRGSLAQTLERRNARVAGTLLGSLAAAALLAFEASPLVQLLTVPLAQGVAHAFAVRRYLVTSIAATIMALTQAHLLDASHSATFESFERIVDTLIGVGIAWAFSYVLPSWERNQIPALVARVMSAHERHARLALALGQLEAVDNEPELEWRLARREVYDALSALVQATQRSLSEPRAVRPPVEALGRFTARSYQFLAQLTSVKTMLLLRRGRLDAAQLAEPLQRAGEEIAIDLVATPRDAAGAPAAVSPTEVQDLPDPFGPDLSPWLLRRLYLATELARQVQRDAEEIRRAPGGRRV